MAVDDTELFVPQKARAMAGVYMHGDPSCYLIAETPEEAASLRPDANGYVRFTLANDSAWNGRHVFIQRQYIASICPNPTDNED